jgi:hypothetical protein
MLRLHVRANYFRSEYYGRENLYPRGMVRQWVLSLPFVLRYRMAYDARLISDVLNVFIRALFGELRRRARELLNLGYSQCGAVTFVQRFWERPECERPFPLSRN